MTRPGTRLRALAQRLCGTATMERLIDPAIADLQHEHQNAVRRGLIWRSRWILVAGYLSCAKVIAIAVSARVLRQRIVADDRAAVRTLVFSLAAVVLLTALFMLPPIGTFARRGSGLTLALVFTLVPQALAIALPLGLVFGVLLGLRNRQATSQVTRTITLIGIGCSVAAFVLVALLLPAANQRFRELAAPDAIPRPMSRGYNELTLDELGSADLSRLGRTIDIDAEQLPFEFQFRLALAFAPLALSLLALGVSVRRRRSYGPVVTAVAALAIGFGYYVLMNESREAWSHQLASPLVAGWMPNLVVVLSALLLRLRMHAPSAAGPSRRDA